MSGVNIDFVPVNTRPLLRQVSSFLAEGIEAIHAKGMSENTCFGDVYVGLVSGELACTLFRVGGEITGFYITEFQAQHNGDRSLYLAYVYVAPTPIDLTPYVVDSFEQLAREHGCTNIIFRTTRSAWGRRLGKYGFNTTAVELTKSLG